MVQQSTDILAGEDLEHVLNDLHEGLQHIRLELFEKLKFWQALPWLFAGLLHRCEARAAQVARRILDMLRLCADPDLLPRLARAWLAPDIMAELQALAERLRPRHTLVLLCRLAAPYVFMPTTERPVESLHAYATFDLCGRRKFYPVTVSLANRLPEIERRIKRDPHVLKQLSEVFAKVTLNGASIARCLCLQHVPPLDAYIKKKHKNTK